MGDVGESSQLFVLGLLLARIFILKILNIFFFDNHVHS